MKHIVVSIWKDRINNSVQSRRDFVKNIHKKLEVCEIKSQKLIEALTMMELFPHHYFKQNIDYLFYLNISTYYDHTIPIHCETAPLLIPIPICHEPALLLISIPICHEPVPLLIPIPIHHELTPLLIPISIHHDPHML